jgi:extracellular factor (EF) 3-hydroxypalmitic acid methyl ester biosynthesis protein
MDSMVTTKSDGTHPGPAASSRRSGSFDKAASAHRQNLRELLDRTCERLAGPEQQQDEINHTLDALVLDLHDRRSDGEQEWRDALLACRNHPLRSLLHEDPFTRHAYTKPRGYPGDAALLDLIYGREEHWSPPEASALGQCVFNYTTAAPAPEGVRARRGFVAGLVDRLAESLRRPHILSVAAGHLREAELCGAVKRRRIGRYVALDSDAESLQEVTSCYGRFGVQTVQASVRRLLTNHLELGGFDLVYSTGLFDYLRQPIGQRLVGKLFRMLRPDGRLLVANFMPGIRDVGYMEVYMDWQLIYRTRQEMIDLTSEIPQADIRDIRLFSEESRNIIFLEITRDAQGPVV